MINLNNLDDNVTNKKMTKCLSHQNKFLNVLSLWDSGCTSSIISETLFQKLPQYLKNLKISVRIPMGTALASTQASITGRVKLMVALGENEKDKYPLIFSHNFFIGEGLRRDMYIGSDLVNNTNFKVSENGSSDTFPPIFQNYHNLTLRKEG